MNTYTNDPSHWTNRYPWNRKNTNLRLAIEQFLRVMHHAPGAEIGDRRAVIDWLHNALDKEPRELFP